MALWVLTRDMDIKTSQTVIVGPYLSLEAREWFKHDFKIFIYRFMKLHVILPEMTFRNAKLAIDWLIDTLRICMKHSKARMESNLPFRWRRWRYCEAACIHVCTFFFTSFLNACMHESQHSQARSSSFIRTEKQNPSGPAVLLTTFF